jgi:aspartate racemase
MEDGFIKDWLKKHYEVDVVVPSSPARRHELQRIIQEELGMGIFKQQTKRYVLQQIAELQRHGAQGIILGCTEFPLIIDQADVAIPVLDTTRLHSELAVSFALGRYTPRSPAT